MLTKIGSTGPTVGDLQEMLNVALPSTPLLNLDGIFGPKTNQRVVTFQKQAGLMADGVVGPLTSKVLGGSSLQANEGPASKASGGSSSGPPDLPNVRWARRVRLAL